MIETEALQSIRGNIIESLAFERPDSLQTELLDELCAVDRQLGATALFVIGRGYYQPPVHYRQVEGEPEDYQQEGLC